MPNDEFTEDMLDGFGNPSLDMEAFNEAVVAGNLEDIVKYGEQIMSSRDFNVFYNESQKAEIERTVNEAKAALAAKTEQKAVGF